MMRLRRNLARAALVGLVLGIAFKTFDAYRDEHNKVYVLQILVPVVTPLEVGLHAHESLLITHVVRKTDGAICFDLVEADKPGCIKVENYYMVEQAVE